MSKVVVIENLTLDGVMQAPGRPDEDPRGGFEHGGWAAPYSDDAMGRVMGDGMGEGGAVLLGRRTYEGFAAFWQHQTDGNLVVLGSGELVASLTDRGLVDEFVLLMHPLVLGSGRRLFRDGGASAALQLVDSVTTSTGVIIGTYRPAP